MLLLKKLLFTIKALETERLAVEHSSDSFDQRFAI